MWETILRISVAHLAARFTRAHPSTRVGIFYQHLGVQRVAFHVLKATKPLQKAYLQELAKLHPEAPFLVIREDRAGLTIQVAAEAFDGSDATVQRWLQTALAVDANVAELVFEHGRGWARVLHTAELASILPTDLTVLGSQRISHGPESDFLARRLTSDEAETLRLAVRLGYYEKPRQCTMDDLAASLGLTKSAVCHRLNKIEQRAVRELLATRAVVAVSGV